MNASEENAPAIPVGHELPGPGPAFPETHIRLIKGDAGHGPARAYGYIALARAFGAEATLKKGGTRSTGRHPLEVEVQADEETFTRINDMHEEISVVAEETAAQRRAEVRAVRKSIPSYEISLLTRAVLAGFPQGAASALAEPGTTRPQPFREATRARLANEEALRAAVASGRAWADRHLVSQEG